MGLYVEVEFLDKWAVYEAEKTKLKQKKLPPGEYEKAIRQLARDLRLWGGVMIDRIYQRLQERTW